MANELGALIIDLTNQELAPEERELLQHPLVGGVILFSRNYESRRQLQSLCQAIRSTRAFPLLIMVDQEGGRVQRFIKEFTRLPSMSFFGHLYNENSESACQLAEDCGWLMATELLSVGIDLSLAPVLDLNNKASNVIGERAFHANPHIVISLAKAFIRGMKQAGMAATGKHFPGHGKVLADSHLTLPIDERSFDELAKDDMVPFANLVKADIPAVMAAHIIFKQVDERPVGFSSIWLKNILRDRLGFKGSVFSDDLTMEGANISAHYADRFLAARHAGCDFTLICNNRQGVIQVLDEVHYASHLINNEKYFQLKADFVLSNTLYDEHPRWQKTHLALQQFNNPGYRAFARHDSIFEK